ncbi:MAG: alpha/beta hydrolase [Verrucomicrobia bacterium]|nr:alpha/beta hydrolase [Verrucomicrobiota bacterium]
MGDKVFKLSTGRALGYAEYGDPTGAPLFYFHGWPSSRVQGELLDETGKRRGLRIIAPDRPGIGLSEFHPGRTLADWPSLVRELAEQVGAEKFYVLGVSGGGPYALACAHAMPERLLGVSVVCGAPSLRNVGTDGLFWAYKLAMWVQHRVPFALRHGLRVSAWVAGRKITQWPQNFLSRFYAAEDRRALQDENMHRIMMQSGRIALLGNVSALRLDGMIYQSDWGFDLGEIQMPVRFWHGDEDWNIPLGLAQKTAALVPGAIFKVTPKDGHYSLPILRADEIVQQMTGEG